MIITKESYSPFFLKFRAVFVYDDANKIVLKESGTGYDSLLSHFADDVRAYGFVRIETGDELRYGTVQFLIKHDLSTLFSIGACAFSDCSLLLH